MKPRALSSWRRRDLAALAVAFLVCFWLPLALALAVAFGLLL